MNSDKSSVGQSGNSAGNRHRLSGWIAALVAGLAVGLGGVALLWPLDQRLIAYHPQDLVQFLVATKALGLGQALYSDQLTALGPLNFYLLRWGEMLVGTPAGGFQIGVVLSAIICLALGVVTVWNRISPLPAVFFVAVLIATTLTPVNIGDVPHHLSVAMHYNKWGYSLLSMVFVCVFLPAKPSRLVIDLAIIGVALTLCFYIKITYFIVGSVAVLIGSLLPFHDLRARRIMPVAILVLGACLAAFPGNWPYLGDIVRSGLQSDVAVAPLYVYSYLIAKNLDLIGLTTFAFLAYAISGGEQRTLVLSAIAVIICGSLGVLSQNAHWHLLPSAVPVFVLLYERLPRDLPQQRWAGFRILVALAVVAYPSLLLYNMGDAALTYAREGTDPGIVRYDLQSMDGIAMRQVGVERVYKLVNAAPAAVEAISSSVPLDINIATPAAYMAQLSNAHGLIVELDMDGKTVFTADAVNGGALFGETVPAPGWHQWVQTGFVPLPVAPLFDAVDIVLLPHLPETRSVRDRILSVYGEYISQNFVVARQNGLWTVCVTKNGEPSAAGPVPVQPCKLPI